MIGKTLAHYEITGRLGKGGMGEVYRARDPRLRRDVAIKVLPPALTADKERRLRFEREAQAAAALSHPNIAVIHEIGEHEGTPFLVMELMRGLTLDEAVAAGGLTLQQWLGYATPIASALAHAHRNGIAHRDLKPSNVMVTDEGHIKLLDFGLAKILDNSDKASVDELDTISRELTRAGSVVGTVAYMSPEQARGGAVDHRTDIFSFGVLLYRLASGRLPFTGDSHIESLNATLTAEAPPLTEIAPAFGPEASRVLAKAMEKEPDRRYQSADEIVTDLRNLERDLGSGRVPHAGTPGPGEVEATKGGPSKPALAVVSLVVLGLAYAAWQLWPANRPTAPQEVATGPTRIVVFPFENLGPPEDEYFSDGITEEIIGRLASSRDLSVVSRSSSFQYDKAGKSLQQIGADFDVEYVLEGTVRWARGGDANRVRIAPQLVRVGDDTSIWGESYDAPMDDIFEVQSKIAGQVIDALGVVLVGAERTSIEARPTENQEAYRAYLRGTKALKESPTAPLAQEMYQRAVELDPGFAVAWAGLSRAHSWRFHGGDRSQERQQAALAAAEEALRLAPASPEAHMAMGLYHYRCFRDYERALAQIDLAAEARPNDIDPIQWKATLHKRRGNFEESLRLHQRVLELNPMDYGAANEMGVTHRLAGEFAEAIEAYNLSIAINPDNPAAYYRKSEIYFTWKGSTEEARATLERMPARGNPLERLQWYWLEFLEGRHEDALARARSWPETLEDQQTLNVRPALVARCLEQLGRAGEAGTSWQQAAAALERQRQERPEDFRVYLDIAVPLAKLGRGEGALDAARHAIELMPMSKDVEAGVAPLENLVLTHVVLGQYTEATQALDGLPAGTKFTVPYMRLDPRFADFVQHPSFVAFAGRQG